MIIITSLLQRGNWGWKVICSKLHILIWGRFRNWTYACVITNYSNWPSWHGHLWRIQSWGQSCPLYRGGGGRHPHIHMANCQEGPPEWRWQTLNSIRFSKWQVTRYMKGNNDKALSFSKCSNIISWEAQVKSIRPCLPKRSREFNNLLKIAKPIIDGAGTRIHSFWIPNIFYFSLGQVGLNGIPDPENWARTEGGMLQQTSLFGRTPSQQAFCQVAWCTRFSFKLCIWTQPAEGTSIASQSCTQSFSLWAFSATLLLKGREK